MQLTDPLDELVAAVRSSSRYSTICEDLVRRIGAEELNKRRGIKEAIKATRSKLHQVAGAYREAPQPYPKWLSSLRGLETNLSDPNLKEFCLQVMASHASTRERLPFVETFFTRTLASLSPIHSILDLGCGLNPFALPWIPLAPEAPYYACDIFEDQVSFITLTFSPGNKVANRTSWRVIGIRREP